MISEDRYDKALSYIFFPPFMNLYENSLYIKTDKPNEKGDSGLSIAKSNTW